MMNKRRGRRKIQVSNYYNEVLANNVIKIRTTHKQSQTAFAKNCGISQSTLKCIENAMGNPRLSTMSKIARYVGLETSQLFEEDLKI